jgi:hypothetical protein
VAVLVTALAGIVGASVGSAAQAKKVIPPNPLKPDLAKVAGLKIKPGGFPNNPRDA